MVHYQNSFKNYRNNMNTQNSIKYDKNYSNKHNIYININN